MEVPVLLQNIFQYIDKNEQVYIQCLTEAVKIPSVSGIPNYREDVFRMVYWMEEKLKVLGVITEVCDIGTQVISTTENNSTKIALAPVLLGQLGNDPKKKTILVYGHLDVQPAAKEDGWDTEPFKLIQKNGKLYGRGASDDKGPCIAWLNAVEAYQKLNHEIPVNIKFIFEGMEECGSVGLEGFLKKRSDFLESVNCVCISDARWLGTKTPCLIYGLRGTCYFSIEIECASKDLHSGTFGGSVFEAMSDLVFLLDSLVDSSGKILVPDILEDVLPTTCEELKTYENIDFCVKEFKKAVGCEQLLHEDKIKILTNTWRYPSLSIHGIEGAFSDHGSKTVIPKKVIGKFSIRIVPNQDPEKIAKLVIDYLDKKWKTRKSPNNYKTSLTFSSKPWLSSVSHYNYTAAIKATEFAYNRKPDMIRIGGSIPVTLTFQEIMDKNVLVLPIGAGDDNAHSQNEKINIANLIQGTKLLAAYIFEISCVKEH
ncbi:cytosolic non-specific dipeptidase-like [Lycorma delicatula]|uniref:cytosolic non-specific dipeptidase-like n=1 Tax=Lycorma delicatula TaxID=130591 RepID=UPI003F513F8C